jgi:solute carrier family 36 (proton-coupled amino acid transporter)
LFCRSLALLQHTPYLFQRISKYVVLGVQVCPAISHLHYKAFVLGVTQCAKLIPSHYFIALQTLILLPLALIRDLAKLSSTALIADVFILMGLLYIFGTEASIIAKDGIADVKLFNPKDFALFIGYVSELPIGRIDCEHFTGPLCFRLKGSAWYGMVFSAHLASYLAFTLKVIPIRDSMREPRKFPQVMTWVMVFLTGIKLLSTFMIVL